MIDKILKYIFLKASENHQDRVRQRGQDAGEKKNTKLNPTCCCQGWNTRKLNRKLAERLSFYYLNSWRSNWNPGPIKKGGSHKHSRLSFGVPQRLQSRSKDKIDNPYRKQSPCSYQLNSWLDHSDLFLLWTPARSKSKSSLLLGGSAAWRVILYIKKVVASIPDQGLYRRQQIHVSLFILSRRASNYLYNFYPQCLTCKTNLPVILADKTKWSKN